MLQNKAPIMKPSSPWSRFVEINLAQILKAVEVMARTRPIVTPTTTYTLFCSGLKWSSGAVMMGNMVLRLEAFSRGVDLVHSRDTKSYRNFVVSRILSVCG